VRGRGILGTSPVYNSREFARKVSKAAHLGNRNG
jgi:hypothetical protein